MKWISVNERLPKFNELVLAYMRGPSYRILFRRRDETKDRGWCWSDLDGWDGYDRNDCIGFSVTYWILIEPPEDNE